MAAYVDREVFYENVRESVFGGTLTASQVKNMDQILYAIESEGVTNPYWIGAIFATVRLEVGSAMAPVREGFAKTNAGAIAAVTKLYKAGKIKTNYALPDPETGLSYYGRGYPQTTWKDNYLKSGEAIGVGDMFVKDPDKLLDPYYAARAMIAMMLKGGYRKGKSLSSMLGQDTPTWRQMVDSREIINGDKLKRRAKGGLLIGEEYANFLLNFAKAVSIKQAPEYPTPPRTPVVPEPEVVYNPPAPVIRTFWQKLGNFILNGEWK